MSRSKRVKSSVTIHRRHESYRRQVRVVRLLSLKTRRVTPDSSRLLELKAEDLGTRAVPCSWALVRCYEPWCYRNDVGGKRDATGIRDATEFWHLRSTIEISWISHKKARTARLCRAPCREPPRLAFSCYP